MLTGCRVEGSIANGATHAFFLQGIPETIFTPTGVVALAFYQSDTGSAAHILAAVMHGS